uniref:Uncharacterized protein n=1 Tax=Mucochytrium quahogii TaxID=96639 RepID=A0A7S2SKW3_9STRA|mmetsp:Transcript_13784/g.22491  ORF Transcript_13784/g.22491 Transcript_13784/m.22491 type:complete len:223 (-) Transcript_13784:37-705(-)
MWTHRGTGNGRYYSAGADFAGSIKPAKPSSIKLMAEKKNEQLFNNFIDFPKPLIAAINGPALGASVTSARLCDVIVTSENASFVTPFNKIGVVPEGCSSRNFPKIFGEQGAKEMFDGKVLTPEEALRVGFVEYVVPPGKLLEKAQEVAEEWIAQGRQRTCIEQGTVDELRKINAIESKALGNALLDYPFLDHMTQFTYQKSKYAAFVIFWIARTTRPLWSNL